MKVRQLALVNGKKVFCTLFEDSDPSKAIDFLMALREKRSRQGFDRWRMTAVGSFAIAEGYKKGKDLCVVAVCKDDQEPVWDCIHFTSLVATAAPQAPVPSTGTQVEDGTYTVVFEDGSYRTLRISTVKDGDLAGHRIVGYLTGPDNSLDFQGFAFLNGELKVWKRYQQKEDITQLKRAFEVLCQNPGEAGMAYAMKSSRCCRCGRKLTVPASIHQGMGPECAAKRGM